MLPYFVTCAEDSIALFQLSDGRFQQLQQGNVASFAAGYQYLLVQEDLARYLKSLNLPRVLFEPALVLNRLTGEEIRSHARVVVQESFAPDEINTLELQGPRLLCMSGEYFFVSPALKQLLEESPFKYLQFSEGLEGFASAA